MSSPAVRIVELKKSFGSIVAVDGISLDVERGKIFGLLGPNGAGKTTTVKILATLVRPDQGTVEVCGVDVLRDPKAVRRVIGYVPQELTIDPYLTVREHLDFYADLYHLDVHIREARIAELSALMGLADLKDRRARHFSGGMKKKLDLACGLLHRPAVLFLDEPSLGLDVPIRREVWNYIAGLREEGTTIFLCTNYMDEAERLCDEVAIIDRGRVAALGSPEMLRSQLKGDVVSIEISSSGEDRQRLEALERAVSRLQIVKGTVRDGTVLRIYVESDDKALTQIVEAATALTIPIDSITHSRPGLDEVFLRCTGRALAEETDPHG